MSRLYINRLRARRSTKISMLAIIINNNDDNINKEKKTTLGLSKK